MAEKNQIYSFGEFQIDLGQKILLRNGQSVAITPKCFDTLVFLAKNPGRVLQKEDLLKALWPDSHVEERNLNQHMYTLRKILGNKNEDGEPYIETMPRRGYRFVASVRVEASAQEINFPEAAQSSLRADYWEKHSPFRGLQVFEPEDYWLFFGRDAEIADLLVRLSYSPVLALAGNSGCGKSSLVQAGLIPALQGHIRFQDVPPGSWRIAVFRPSGTPFDRLAEALQELEPGLSLSERTDFIADCRKKLPLGGDALRNAIAALARFRAEKTEHMRILLVADQFEELFTLTSDQDVRDRYIDVLLAASEFNGGVPVHLAIILRADFYGHCLEHSELSRRLENNLYNVPRMSREQIRKSIERRLALAATQAESGLIDSLLEDVGAEPGNLALMEHALSRLWEKRKAFDSKLTNQAYSEIGRLRGALSRYADEVYANINGEERKQLARRIFITLVQFNEGARDTRRRAAKAELLALGNPEQVNILLSYLASKRLLSIGSEDQQTFVEVSHEALIREWSLLREWIVQDREEIQLERRLARSAEEWQALNRDCGALLQGIRLDQAEDWLQKHPGTLLREFIEASGTARKDAARKEQQAQDRTRRSAIHFRWLSYTLAGFLLAIGVLAVIAWREKRNAETMLARSAVQDGMRLFQEGRPDQAAAYFARALRTAPDSVAATSWLSDLLVNLDWWMPSAAMRHQGPVGTAEFSPDGHRIVTASQDRTAQVWEAETGKPVGTPMQHQGWVDSAEFSPDGHRIVTASYDHTARVWEAETGKPVGTPMQHQGWVVSAEFSPDGQRVVTASYDHTARVWEAATGKPVGAPIQHQGKVFSAAFSPDGHRIVTASEDHTARLWEAATGKPVGAPMQHQGMVLSAAFSPDGHLMVTASADYTARVWEAATGKPVGTPMQHGGWVRLAVFSPDGHRIVTVSDDQTARVWEAATGKPVGAPVQHQGWVYSATFSPDGRRIATASGDQTAWVWEAATGKPVSAPMQHQGPVLSAAFSPDGHRIVTTSGDQTARVWEAATGKPVGVPIQHQGPVLSAAFSPDGHRIVTASGDQTARVWEAETGKPVGVPMQHHGKVFSATFSPDGHRIVTASEDHTARVWEAETSKPVGAPIEQGGPLHSAAFSPEGHRIVTASEDNTARVWEVETGKPVGVPMQHHGKVFSATFSPEGQRIVTASEDHTARVWEAATGKPVSAPMQHHGKVFSAAFSPDGHRIVTASEDHTARVWPVLLICCASQAEADRLASLAEAVGCNQVGDTASLSIFNGHELLHELNRHSTTGAAPELTLDWIVRRFGSRKYREDRR